MNKIVDPAAIIQVIGCVYNNPSLLEQSDKYTIIEDDFVEDFHKIVFGSIFKLQELGAEQITLETISDFLAQRPKSEAIYKQNKGNEWLLKASAVAQENSFNYYYSRLKKFTLLRAYVNNGIDISDIYDTENIFDTAKKQQQEDLLDNSSLDEIALTIESKIDAIHAKYVDDCYENALPAGEGISELVDSFLQHPEVGYPLFGPLINTVTRGARLKKFYLWSGATGTGKSRLLASQACYIAAAKIYDEALGWIDCGPPQPVLLITTELELSEVQTMLIAFLSNVNEEHIINGLYMGDEYERVKEATKILAEAPLYVEVLPDFSLKDIEDRIKKNIRERGVKYVFHDYVHTSMRILEEISQRSGGVKLREDNVLFMLSNKLKDLCNKYGIFIMSATQLSGDYAQAETPDQNLLRGAKSIADKIDFGCVMLGTKDEDLQKLDKVLAKNIFKTPNMKISVYKNRRGRYKGIYLWAYADLGTCRILPQFATDYSYQLIPMEDIRIQIENPPPSMWSDIKEK